MSKKMPAVAHRILAAWRASGLPVAVAEHPFAPPRKWRFDFAFIEQRVAVEVQGGLWTGGRHTRGAALVAEYEKLREAAARGWLVLPVPPAEVLRQEFIEQLKRAMEE